MNSRSNQHKEKPTHLRPAPCVFRFGDALFLALGSQRRSQNLLAMRSPEVDVAEEFTVELPYVVVAIISSFCRKKVELLQGKPGPGGKNL